MESVSERVEFPGRWLGAASLIVGPVLWLVGVALRLPAHFFFPQQLEAVVSHPLRTTTAYALVAIGQIALWPGVLILVQRTSVLSPRLARWGGAMVLFGLFARTFHAGIDHLAFQLALSEGAARATGVMQHSYGAFQAVSIFTAAEVFGWAVLAVGAWRARVLGPIRAVALASMSALMVGVLKGTTWVSLFAVTGLVVALMPLGVNELRRPPAPSIRTIAAHALIGALIVAGLFWLGQLG